MTKSTFVIIAHVIFLLGISFTHRAANAAAAAHAAPPPNIVLILADDMGYGDLACYGRPDIETPVLDRLARQGVRFTDYYANGAECTPTRAALLTGRYQQWIGGLECAVGTGNVGRYDDAVRLRATHDLGLPTDTQTIVRLLKNAGYATAITGKWHLGYEPKFAPHLHGFDHTFYCIGGGMDYFYYLDTVAGYNLFQDGQPIARHGYFTDLVTDEAIEFVKAHKNTPFFLYVPYTAPHAPFQGPNDDTHQPLPMNSPLWNQGTAPPAVYIAMIERLDQQIGRLLNSLDSMALSERTVVIFASDNGGTKSARNLPFSNIKGTTFEGGIRVPAMIRWPGVIRPGTVSHQSCITYDLTASIAAVAGVKPAPSVPLEGIDIIRHVANNRPDIPRTLYWRKPRGNTTWMGVRDGNMKFVALQRGYRYEEHLFNLPTDPAEKNDLAQRQRDELARLRLLYRQWEQRTRRSRRGRPGWELYTEPNHTAPR